jgi:hypothetical protein
MLLGNFLVMSCSGVARIDIRLSLLGFEVSLFIELAEAVFTLSSP